MVPLGPVLGMGGGAIANAQAVRATDVRGSPAQGGPGPFGTLGRVGSSDTNPGILTLPPLIDTLRNGETRQDDYHRELRHRL